MTKMKVIALRVNDDEDQIIRKAWHRDCIKMDKAISFTAWVIEKLLKEVE